MAKAKAQGKMIANNKKAYHDYFILDTYEAGIALAGTEVKSLRMGKCSIKESFIRIAAVSYTHLEDFWILRLYMDPVSYFSDRLMDRQSCAYITGSCILVDEYQIFACLLYTSRCV